MPKRVPTPPPSDDEPRYLTVVHPYAISGTCNMELPKDRQDFARWVACCVDKDAFLAMFHKPSSRAMVIIEIRRDYPSIDNILGEHPWSEFLQNPTEEEMGRSTKVFHCTYHTGRIVQKNGWKRIDVEEAWFNGWSPKNRHIKFPYPKPHLCDVPVEDRTNHPLCRPIPGVKAPPEEVIAAPQPVVGSAAWIQTKEAGPSPATRTKRNGPGGNGTPRAQAASAKPNPTANGSVKRTASIPQTSQTGTRLPAVGGGPVTVKASNVWQNTGKNPPVMTNWEDSPPVSREGTPVSRAAPPATAHQAPTANAWGSDDPGKLSTTSWGSAAASISSPDSELGPTATESDNPYNVHVDFAALMEEEFHGMGIRDMEDEDELRGLDVIAPGAWDDAAGGPTWDTTSASGWDNDPLDAEDLWRQNQETDAKPILCNAHGIICKRGICAEYARQLRLAKRTEEEEKRRVATGANRGKKSGRGRGRGRGIGKKNDDNEDQSGRRNNPFRGPGAPVKTNWRGAAPRAIVSADSIEEREANKAISDDGWANSDPEVELNTVAVIPAGSADGVSDASWGVSEGAYDPWATPAQPNTKVNHASGKPRGKKPGRAKASSSWADQVEVESAGDNANKFSPVTSQRNPKRGKASATSWGTSTAKSSASGRGSIADTPW